MPTVAIYAGSFDPITRGHEDVIRRSREFVDRLVVAVAGNSNKQPLFSLEERVGLIQATLDAPTPSNAPTSTLGSVNVCQFDGLLVDFAAQQGASLIIRGLRAVSDFEYEFQMALMNRHLSPSLETVFMVPSVETTYISSSIVREVARYGGELGTLVHPVVADALRTKFGHTTPKLS